MRRRLPVIAACLFAVFIAVIAALPWLLEPVLARIGHSWGANFGAYERIGYSRFALRDVEVRQPGVRVTVSRVEADTPVVWLWRRWTDRPCKVLADRWSVSVEGQDGETIAPPTVTADGWIPLRGILVQVAAGLDHWLPQASVGPGVVRWPGGGLTIASAAWRGGVLVADNVKIGPLKARATLSFSAGKDVIQLAVRAIDVEGTASLKSTGENVAGIVTGWQQSASLNARFGPQGWLPAEARLKAEAWQVPGERLMIGDLYSIVRGHGKIDWREGHFDADLEVNGESAPGKSAPALEATLRGHGDSQTFTVDALHAKLPGITAQLSEPVTIDRQGRFQQSAAHFSVKAEIAKQPWFTGAGTVSGEARLVAGVAQSPAVDFSLEAQDLEIANVSLRSASAGGHFTWPRVEITTGTLTMADGTLAWRGGWDFHAKELFNATVAGQIGPETFARWLPGRPDFASISINAQAAGPLARLTHTGNARVSGLTMSGLNPLSVAVAWRGRGDIIEQFTAEATVGTTTISAAGALTREQMHLSGFRFGQGDTTHLMLSAPAVIQWSPVFRIDGLRLTGAGDASAAIAWGGSGRIEIAMHRILSAWFMELAPMRGPAWQVKSLAIAGGWDRGPMTFSVVGDAAVDLGGGRTAQLAIAATGDPDGLQIKALRASVETTPIFTATASVPIVFSPESVPLMRINANGPLLIEASTGSDGAFWGKLAELTGIEFKEPRAAVHVTGTWAHPLGEIRLEAARVSMDEHRFRRPLPSMESINVVLTGDSSGLKLGRFSASVEGQAVRAQGRLSMADGGWNNLRHEPLAFAQRSAELHLEVPDADLAALARFLPVYLAPKGRLQVDLNYQGNGAMEGALHLRDAASLPLGPLGVLQEINADVQMSGRRIELRSVTAKAGGQVVTLSGSIQFPANAAPRYDIALRGEDLPFVRQTGLLVRGDLDLRLNTPESGPAALSGNVRLRDSLFLSDVSALLPAGTKGDGPQPPFFAVAAPPFDAWTLGVDIRGDRFMRLRTPVFNGIASARFHLGGTLGAPRAIGEVVVDEGQVLLPFTNFVVKQGTVRIPEEDPHKLALYLRGTGRYNGYDLTMEITGTAEAPTIVFTSSPALDSDQLLMMVMTGAVPNNGTGYSSTQRFARLGTYLGQSLLGSFGVDAASADRLSIVPGETISDQGRETYTVEYKLGDRWKWVGEYDQFDDYNIGLKWRLYPGKRETKAPRDAPK